MGESKPARATKNSQKVASLEGQNKILEEVLKASKEANSGRNKGKPVSNKELSGANPPNSGENGSAKRKADPRSETSPAKKPREEKVPQDEEKTPSVQGLEGSRMILEYPDYEANKEDDFYEGRQSQIHEDSIQKSAGNRATSPDGRRQETARNEHVVSSEEEDIEPFEDPHDSVNEDFLGDEWGWDSRSVASSVIFPAQSSRVNKRAKTGARPDSSKTRSRSQGSETEAKQTSTVQQERETGANEIENLVRERAGVDAGKDSVGPPIADCIAELLKSYLKDPSTDAVLKLVEEYPRPINAEWLQAPTLGTQITASIPKRSNNFDKRLKQSQSVLGGSLAAMASVLQDIMNRGKHDSSLLGLAKKVMDAMALSGYVHFDFNTLRKGAIRQVVNPNYAGVFTRKTSSTPDSLLGENSVPEQLKEHEEINKVRAKLQKPRKSGGYDHRQENGRG